MVLLVLLHRLLGLDPDNTPVVLGESSHNNGGLQNRRSTAELHRLVA